MKNRCSNEQTWAYEFYGEQGITVCDEWFNNVVSFYDWAVANGYSDNLTLDRIDGAKGYSPDNCRWVDRKVQGVNKKSTVWITWNGETHTLSEWSKILGIKESTLSWRCRHWTIEKAFTEPLTSGGGYH
jgi:hypothetical protein